MAAERQRRKPGPKLRPMTIIETFEPTPDGQERWDRAMDALGELVAQRVIRERAEQEQAS